MPVVTREAEDEEVTPEEYLGKIAQALFVKKQAMTEEQKEALVEDINEMGEELSESDNEEISVVGNEMAELNVEDLTDDNQKNATKIASFAKKIIIIGERKMAETNLNEAEEMLEEKKIAFAEKLVKLAKVLKSKKKDLTASQEKTLSKLLIRYANEAETLEAASDDDKLDKADWGKSFDKTRSKNNKQLKMLNIDWDALSAYGVTENAIVKNLTVDQLKRIIMNIK